jgi:hypothetical protein
VALVLLLSLVAGAWWLLRGTDDDTPAVAAASPEERQQVQPPPVIPVRPSPTVPVVPPVVPGGRNPVPVEPPVRDPVNPSPPVEEPSDPTPPARDPFAARPEEQPKEAPPTSAPSPIAALFPPPPADTRAAVPDRESQAEKAKQIESLFSVSAARSAAQRSEMAEGLLRTARETTGDPAAKYVLLDTARAVAAAGGHHELALKAVDGLNDAFQVDGSALRAESFAEACQAPAPVAVKAMMVEPGIKLVDELFVADRYIEAAKLIKALQALTVKTRDKEQRAILASRQDQGSELFKAYRDAQNAIETLKKSPDDAEAALIAGKYYAFFKGDWQRGLVMLSVATDEKLKELAAQEMKPPRTSEEQLALADAWAERAEATRGLEADRQKARAAMWYKRGSGSLTGLAKVEVDRKVEALGKLAVNGGAPFKPSAPTTSVATGPGSEPPARSPEPPAAGEVIDLLKLVDVDKHAVQGRFTRNGNSVVMPDGGFNRLLIPHHPPEEYTLMVDVTRKKERFRGHDLAIGLVYQGVQCAVLIDRLFGAPQGLQSHSTLSGTGNRNGGDMATKMSDDPVLAPGRRSRVVCHVSKAGITVAVDGKELLAYQGPVTWRGIDGPWGVPDRRALMIGGLNEPFEIHAMTLHPLQSAPSSGAPQSNNVDLLAGLDLKANAVLGTWRIVDGELISPRIADGARLQIPAKVPAEYDLDLEVTRNGGGNELAIGMIYQGKQCSVGIDRYSMRATDIVADTGTNTSTIAHADAPIVLKPGKRSQVKCAVRKDSIAVSVDGREIVAYRGKADWLGMNKGWAVPDESALMLGGWFAEFKIHAFTLTPIGNDDAVPAAVGEMVDLMPLVDVKQDVAKGTWRKADTVLISARDGEASIRVPYIPAREYDLHFDVAFADDTVDVEVKLPYGGEVLTFKIDSQPGAAVGVVRRFRCEVRRSGIDFYQNGKFATKIARDPTAPLGDNDDAFYLVTNNTLATISGMRLKELAAGGRPLRDVAPSADIREAVFLDDLVEASAQSYSPTIGKHGKTGLPNDGKDPQELVLGGKRYEHALFAAADNRGVSSIVYNLGGKYRRFRATAGIADQAHQFRFSGPLKFSLIGDGKVLWTSGEFTRHGQTAAVDVDIAGVRQLELRGQCLGGNNICAWCTWLEPQIAP